MTKSMKTERVSTTGFRSLDPDEMAAISGGLLQLPAKVTDSLATLLQNNGFFYDSQIIRKGLWKQPQLTPVVPVGPIR